MGTDIIQFNKKFKSLLDHNDRRYEFHPDWDISTIFATSDVERSESEIEEFFRKDVEFMIPPEYRNKIEYHCEYRESKRLYYIWWLYPGKTIHKKAS